MFKKCAVCSLPEAVFFISVLKSKAAAGMALMRRQNQPRMADTSADMPHMFQSHKHHGPTAGSTNTLWTGKGGGGEIFSHINISLKSVRRILFVQVSVRYRDTLGSEKTWTGKPNKI